MTEYGTIIMISVNRILDLSKITREKSCFLFGPRQVGKSWLVRRTLPNVRIYDLLDDAIFAELNRNPHRIEQEWKADPRDSLIVVDEIQRLPRLLNEVHRLIELHGIRFLLTGSSGRKLRRGGTNLLGGRARVHRLNPFVSAELGERYDLGRAVNNGLIPSIYFSNSPDADLDAYAGAYLREEIAAEAVTRNVPAFSRFLSVAAAFNGQIINFTRIANDSQVPRTTVMEYFEILKDTLIGFEVPAWRQSVKRKPFATSKFYLFDPGVVRRLQGRGEIRPGTAEFGLAVETLACHELRSFCEYRGIQGLTYWRSTSGFEVDFILGDSVAIEIKTTGRLASSDLKGLRALREEGRLRSYICIVLEDQRRVVDGIDVLPLPMFLAELWSGRILPF